MDPTTIATSLASIVSLIGTFRSERRAGEADSYEDFLSWLRTHQHDEVVELLSDNAQLAAGTQSLLAKQHDEVMECLSFLNQIVSDIASRLSLTHPLTEALGIESAISDQAVSILKQLNENDASKFLVAQYLGGCNYMIMDGNGGNLSITEERFVDDDLNKLCDYGLLREDCNSKGEPLYHITRNGAALGSRYRRSAQESEARPQGAEGRVGEISEAEEVGLLPSCGRLKEQTVRTNKAQKL